MLNADMALVMDFKNEIDSTTGEVDCAVGECPQASTIDQVAIYAGDNALWLEQFRDAFVKMTLNGHETTDLSHIV
jgi:hypothetical protein